MGLRSLAQLLLGILAFALVIELWTALYSGGVLIGGAGVGAATLLVALIADVVAMVLVSRAGRRAPSSPMAAESASPTAAPAPDAEDTVAYRFECPHCGWSAEAPTMDEARTVAQEHKHARHGAPRPT